MTGDEPVSRTGGEPGRDAWDQDATTAGPTSAVDIPTRRNPTAWAAGADDPQSSTFRAVAWSQDDDAIDEPIPYAGVDYDGLPPDHVAHPQIPDGDGGQRGSIWRARPGLVFGVAAAVAAVGLGALALARTGDQSRLTPITTPVTLPVQSATIPQNTATRPPVPPPTRTAVPPATARPANSAPPAVPAPTVVATTPAQTTDTATEPTTTVPQAGPTDSAPAPPPVITSPVITGGVPPQPNIPFPDNPVIAPPPAAPDPPVLVPPQPIPIPDGAVIAPPPPFRPAPVPGMNQVQSSVVATS